MICDNCKYVMAADEVLWCSPGAKYAYEHPLLYAAGAFQCPRCSHLTQVSRDIRSLTKFKRECRVAHWYESIVPRMIGVLAKEADCLGGIESLLKQPAMLDL